jgi:hypothetical protein
MPLLSSSHFSGVITLRTADCVTNVFPLLADPDGTGSGAGTVLVVPRRRSAFHKNSLGNVCYLQAIFYSPASHELKVREVVRDGRLLTSVNFFLVFAIYCEYFRM